MRLDILNRKPAPSFFLCPTCTPPPAGMHSTRPSLLHVGGQSRTECVAACVASAAVLPQGYLKASESSDEDMVAALSSIYSNRAMGKDLQMDVDAHGPAQASLQEVRPRLHWGLVAKG